MTAQLVLAVLLLWTGQLENANVIASSNHIVATKKRKRRRPPPTTSTTRGASQAETSISLPMTFSSVAHLASVGIGLAGCTLTIISMTLLTSCSFVGATESWSLVLIALFGVLQLVVSILAIFMWKAGVVKSVLVGCLALESYVSSALADFSNSIALPPLEPSGSDHNSVSTTLRYAYSVTFQQNCQPLKHWRLHVCALKNSEIDSPYGASRVRLIDSRACQVEFGALLQTTADNSIILLSWMMAAQITILLWLILPRIRSLLQSTVALSCCRLSGDPNVIVSEEIDDGKKTKQWKHSTLELTEARKLYLSTVRRKDSSTLQTETAAFDAEWLKMVNGGGSGVARPPIVDPARNFIFTYQFEAIVRTLVLRRLTTRCKMDVSLSVSRDGKLLLAKIFASDNLLMTTLCQSGPSYKLQLADAIDPGKMFWREAREVMNDAKLLDAHTVHQKFKLLMLHGVISRKEAEIFPTESVAQVSSRVHALMRIYRWKSGALKADNPHAPFVGYVPHTQLQYLYKRYPNRLDTAASTHRRSAVLRTIDCLRLTRQLLDTEFDLDLMERQRLISAVTELHSASRFDTTSRETLLTSWVAFWKPRHLPGEFEPQSHWLLNQLGRFSPFRQPLQAVRDYFGECIAFYFAWLAFYNQFLLVPTLAVLILVATQTLDLSPLRALLAFCRRTPMESSSGLVNYIMPPSAVALGLGVIVWGLVFAKCWERRSVWYQLEWGMSDFSESALADRANFRGVERRNPVTQQLEVYFPGRERLKRQAMSLIVIGVACFCHLLLCLLLMLAQGPTSEWIGLRPAVVLSSFIVALLILWNGESISTISHQLSEWENHQNERDFQRSVILKVCMLQMCNSYGPVLLVAFAIHHSESTLSKVPILSSLLGEWVSTFQTQVAPFVGAVVELQILLVLIFGTRIVSHLTAMIHGLVREGGRSSAARQAPCGESELELQPYHGCYEDYTEIVVQLGFVVMFSSVFPAAPVLAFVECALEMRLDALDLCLFLRRPKPETADGIGPWGMCIRGVLKLGVVVQFALLYVMANNYAEWSGVRRMGAFLASVFVTWVASEILWLVVPSRSREVYDVLARHTHLVDRYFGGGAASNGCSEANGSIALSDIERKALEIDEYADHESPVEGGVEPAYLQERLMLLRRLNTALRKHGEMDGDDDRVEVNSSTVNQANDADNEDAEDELKEGRATVGYFVRTAARKQEQEPAEPKTPFAPTDTTPSTGANQSIEHFEQTALTGMAAIHVATERERFDFARDTGWSQVNTNESRDSRQSSTRRFSLFRKQQRDQAQTETAFGVAASVANTRTSSVPRSTRRKSTLSERQQIHDQLPVVQLSGLEAVHEAARRDQFDFSTDRE